MLRFEVWGIGMPGAMWFMAQARSVPVAKRPSLAIGIEVLAAVVVWEIANALMVTRQPARSDLRRGLPLRPGRTPAHVPADAA